MTRHFAGGRQSARESIQLFDCSHAIVYRGFTGKKSQTGNYTQFAISRNYVSKLVNHSGSDNPEDFTTNTNLLDSFDCDMPELNSGRPNPTLFVPNLYGLIYR